MDNLHAEYPAHVWKSLFLAQLFYTFTLPTVKISILLFYRRIFVTRSFQIASLTLIGCCVAWFIAIFCLDIWQCTPIQRQWDRSLPGTCVNDRLSFVANGIFSIIIDFCTLLLPMPVIWKLNRAWQDRIGLMGIFALGGLCVSPARRRYLDANFCPKVYAQLVSYGQFSSLLTTKQMQPVRLLDLRVSFLDGKPLI